MLIRDLDAAYRSKICEYCGRYNQNTFPIELFYCRGRKKRWVTACSECAADPAFQEDSRRLVTVDEQGQVYDLIKQIEDVGRPIALIDAIKIAALEYPKVRHYFGVDNTFSEGDRCLWKLIYEIVSLVTDISFKFSIPLPSSNETIASPESPIVVHNSCLFPGVSIVILLDTTSISLRILSRIDGAITSLLSNESFGRGVEDPLLLSMSLSL